MKKPQFSNPNESIKNAQNDAFSDPHHPLVHLTPPAYWMNDPNGLIFWNGEYHLFYQHNPFEAKWGYMHWGHAKTKDLITWVHEPIALAPSYEKNELHCFSGCCVDNHGIPTIIYSSIASLPKIVLGSEQWLAVSDKSMEKWKKLDVNPVLTPNVHDRKKIFHLRDPYVWKQNDRWLMVLGGQHIFPKRGFIGLYESPDLINWKFIGSLIPKHARQKPIFGTIWECPIFFPLPHSSGEKWVLIISPMDKVHYCIGDFDGKQFIPGKWHILDGGRCFYAPNVMQVPNGRKILWGWLKGGGNGKWNGCFTLPRILSLTQVPDPELIQTPAPELEKLRNSIIFQDTIEISSNQPKIFSEIYLLNSAAIEINFDILLNSNTLNSFKIEFFKGKTLLNVKPILELSEDGLLRSGNEQVDIHERINPNDNYHVQIFLDRAFCEVFINNRICISSHQLWIHDTNSISIGISSKELSSPITNFIVWDLHPLTQNFP